MSQIRRIRIMAKLKERYRTAKGPYVPLRLNEAIEVMELIELQAKEITHLDQRLAELMDRLPEDLLKEFSAEVVAEIKGADDEA